MSGPVNHEINVWLERFDECFHGASTTHAQIPGQVDVEAAWASLCEGLLGLRDEAMLECAATNSPLNSSVRPDQHTGAGRLWSRAVDAHDGNHRDALATFDGRAGSAEDMHERLRDVATVGPYPESSEAGSACYGR